MGVHLINLANKDHWKKVNWWNWRPTIELIRKLGIIDDTRLHLMCFNVTGVSVTKEEAQQIGETFQADLLPKINSGQRILLDLSITSEPDDDKFHRDDLGKNYSARYEWLEEFTEFCLDCEGFTVV
ncbi:MAG: hypothetical protein ACFFDI_25580 [Promethearchaeota archaeon]